MSDKTLEEHAERMGRLTACTDAPEFLEARAAYEAERKARLALEAERFSTVVHRRCLAAEASVRELEAERDALVKAHAIRERVFNACAKAELQQRTIDLPAWRTRAEAAEARVRELEAEEASYETTLARCRELLTGVADALKGPPGERKMHDWSDLPAKAAEVVARVRELEAERSAWASSAGRWAGEATAQEDARHVAEAGLSVSETVRRHDEATLAETRAQLARLREAADAHLTLASVIGDEAKTPEHRQALLEACFEVRSALDALSTPGPTLAEIESAALRRAAEDVRSSELPLDTRDVRDWLRQRADDLEAGRE